MKVHFSLFGIPIHVHVTFLVLLAVMGLLAWTGAAPAGLPRLFGLDPRATLIAALVPLVTIGILVHELGHALTAKVLGLSPFVVLHGMGGTTAYRSSTPVSIGRRLAITLMGPFAGIAIGSLALVLALLAPPGLAQASLWIFFVVTAVWGVLNLLPMLPLDGGHVAALVLERFFGPRARPWARLGSIVIAIGIALGLVAFGGQWLFSIVILGMLAFRNWQAFKAERAALASLPLKEALARGFEALERGEEERAIEIAKSILPFASEPGLKRDALHLLAWASLLRGDPARASEVLAGLPPGERPDAFLEGSILIGLGEHARAIEPLVEALEQRGDDDVAERLGDALAQIGTAPAVEGLFASKDRARAAGQRALEVVALRMHEGGRPAEAARLYERLHALFDDPNELFNAACGHARAGDIELALANLEHAADAGFTDLAALDAERDLETVREEPRFEAVRARLTG